MSDNKAFIDFYSEYGIIPVHQDTSDLRAHFTRREGLYRQLGLVPAWLEGKSVIEFGPGTGDNALYTGSLRPGRYVLVDGNAESLKALRERTDWVGVNPEDIQIVDSYIDEYEDRERYDLVLCEGVLPGQNQPAEMLRHIAEFSKPGGAIVVTNISTVSYFPEICRRLMKPIFACRGHSGNELLAELIEVFTPHLNTLKGMSRRYDDWVLDNILHPYENISFSIEDAIHAIGEHFDFHGSSPHFRTDWRWYKEILQQDFAANDMALSQYRSSLPYFLDYRSDTTSDTQCDAPKLEGLCQQAYDIHKSAWFGDDLDGVNDFLEIVREIKGVVEKPMPKAAQSFEDYIKATKRLIAGESNVEFGQFTSMFGRGQQYTSFLRRD